MPKVNNLTGGNKPVETSKTNEKFNKLPTEKQKLDDEGPASLSQLVKSDKESAAIQKSAATLTLPAFLQGSPLLPTVPDRNTGFVGFASTMSERWYDMQMAGLEEGQPFLFHQNQFIPCGKELNFFLLRGESFKTIMVGREGKFVFVTRDMEYPDYEYGNAKLQEHYVCLLLVQLEQRFIPIKGDFRGTKSGGIQVAVRSLQAAQKPEWIQLSEATKVTAAFPQPFGRVFHTLRTTRQISKSGKNKGNPYYRADCTSRPSRVNEMEMLIKAFMDEEFSKTVEESKLNYDERVKFLDRIAAENPNPPT